MATRVIENWSDIFGTVEMLHDAADIKEYVEVQVEVERVETVDGYANLLADAEGQAIGIYVEKQQAQALRVQPGDAIYCRVRRTSPTRAFAHRKHLTVYHLQSTTESDRSA